MVKIKLLKKNFTIMDGASCSLFNTKNAVDAYKIEASYFPYGNPMSMLADMFMGVNFKSLCLFEYIAIMETISKWRQKYSDDADRICKTNDRLNKAYRDLMSLIKDEYKRTEINEILRKVSDLSNSKDKTSSDIDEVTYKYCLNYYGGNESKMLEDANAVTAIDG